MSLVTMNHHHCQPFIHLTAGHGTPLRRVGGLHPLHFYQVL